MMKIDNSRYCKLIRPYQHSDWTKFNQFGHDYSNVIGAKDLQNTEFDE